MKYSQKLAIKKIKQAISDKQLTEGWNGTDLKTTWILRAKQLGISSYSAHLKDMFIENSK